MLKLWERLLNYFLNSIGLDKSNVIIAYLVILEVQNAKKTDFFQLIFDPNCCQVFYFEISYNFYKVNDFVVLIKDILLRNFLEDLFVRLKVLYWYVIFGIWSNQVDLKFYVDLTATEH